MLWRSSSWPPELNSQGWVDTFFQGQRSAWRHHLQMWAQHISEPFQNDVYVLSAIPRRTSAIEVDTSSMWRRISEKHSEFQMFLISKLNLTLYSWPSPIGHGGQCSDTKSCNERVSLLSRKCRMRLIRTWLWFVVKRSRVAVNSCSIRHIRRSPCSQSGCLNDLSVSIPPFTYKHGQE